ncbi:hypothetical protein [Bacteroides cutis]|jgi:hypothetical protein|uniref:hypothetical protein n=1 Tax=Bacteroides cutis TaxID=2024197 RepID=UPI0023A908CA|nr:hypothetical protein [Bacteroides cutis]
MMFKATRKPFVNAVMLLTSLGITTSCIDNGYDLNKDIDMNISVGGDAFTIPLGYSEQTTLDKLIDESETLKKMDDQTYAIKKNDGIDDVSIKVDPVNIKIDEPSFSGTTVDFEAGLDDFNVADKKSSSKLDAPSIVVDVKLPEDRSMDTGKKQIVAGGGTINDQESPFEFTYKEEWPKEVKTIHEVVLQDQSGNKKYGQKIAFNVIAPAGMINITDFTVKFPVNFILYNANGEKQPGNSIQLARGLQTESKATYEFYVYGQKLNASLPTGIEIHDKITYNFTYTTEKAPTSTDMLSVQMEKTDFIFDHALVTTNDIEANMKRGTVEMNTTIDGLEDVNEVHSVDFKDNSILAMDIAKGLELPVDFKSGDLVIEFPSYYKMELKEADNGITYTGNELTIPATALPDAKVALLLKQVNFTGTDKGKPVMENGKPIIKLTDPVTYYLKDNAPMILQKDNISSTDVADLDKKEMDVFVNGGKMEITNAFVDAKSYTAEVKDNTSFEVKEDVDEALKILKTVAWKTGSTPKMTLHINFSDNFPKEEISELEFSDLKIQLPKFVKFAAGIEGMDYDKNVLTLNDKFKVLEGYTKPLETTGMDFSYMNNGTGLKTTVENGKTWLKITDENETKVDILGDVKTLGGDNINTDRLKGITVTPTVTIDEMPVGLVTGEVDPVIDDVDENVELDLGDDLDFLKDEGNELDIKNPQIKLTLNNTVGVPVDMNLTIYGVDENDKEIENSRVEGIKFQLQPTNVGQETKTSVFMLSREAMNMPENDATHHYENVVVSNLNKVMTRVPDRVKFHMNAKANNGTEHHVDISKDMTITGEYDVTVPLQFEDLNINYIDVIDDLHSDLEDVLDKTTSATLEILADALNNVPLDLNLSAKAQDTDGNELTTIEATVYANDIKDGKIGGAITEDSAVKTPILIRLVATSSADLKKLDKLELTIHAKANETTAGLPLKATQWVKIENAKVKIKKANFDLN